MRGVFRKTKLKSICYVFLAIFLASCCFCWFRNRSDASAEEHNYYEVGREPKFYDIIAGLSKGRFPSEYDGNDYSEDGQGVFVLDEHADDDRPVYFYRGRKYVNNNVRFAGFCWQAIRTTTDGGVKLLYNGIIANDDEGSSICKSEQAGSRWHRIGSVSYNEAPGVWEKTGYMYGDDPIPTVRIYDHMVRSRNGEVFGHDVEWDGTKYTLVDTIVPGYVDSFDHHDTLYATHHYTCASTSTSCEEVYYVYSTEGEAKVLSNGMKYTDIAETVFNNYEYDSNVKTLVDNWYADNMLGYTSQLEDAVYCNDREIIGTPFKSNDESMWYGYFGDDDSGLFVSKWRRHHGLYSVDCSSKRDSFTVSDLNGNGQLTYPVGLLTMDEVRMASPKDNSARGYIAMTDGDSHDGSEMWTMSPYFLEHRWLTAYMYRAAKVEQGGDGAQGSVSSYASVRPVITVNSDALVYCGNGTHYEPYALSDEYCDHVRIEDKGVYEALRDCDLVNCPELKGNNPSFDNDGQIIRLTSRDRIYNLILDNRNLKDISDLPVFGGLQNLSLKHNHIEDISPLTRFSSLTSTVELADNNVLNARSMVDICNARTDIIIQHGEFGDAYPPEPCADGSYEGMLNLAFDWIPNQNLVDIYNGDEYEVPDTMWLARYLSEMFFDYRPPEGYEVCDPETDWCYTPTYNRRRDIPAIDIALGFNEDIMPDDLLYIENATIETGDNGDVLHILDMTKKATLSYRISWEDLFGDAWNEISDTMKADIISRSGGNSNYWNIATLTLRPEYEPVPEHNDSETSLPQTVDSLKNNVFGLIAALLGSFGICLVIARKRQ